MRVFKPDEPRLLLGVLDGGVLEGRVMRLLDARVPWGRRWWEWDLCLGKQ